MIVTGELKSTVVSLCIDVVKCCFFLQKSEMNENGAKVVTITQARKVSLLRYSDLLAPGDRQSGVCYWDNIIGSRLYVSIWTKSNYFVNLNYK